MSMQCGWWYFCRIYWRFSLIETYFPFLLMIEHLLPFWNNWFRKFIQIRLSVLHYFKCLFDFNLMEKLLNLLNMFLIWQNKRIQGLLEKCTLDHEARMEILHNELRERALLDSRWRQIQEELSQSVCANDRSHLLYNVCKLDANMVATFYF